MAIDFATLARPLSADEPCGPDLDIEGDAEFAQFVARAEGLFPPSFFTRDDEGRLQPFDRTSIDFPAEFKALDALLERSRDLRLLTIYARLLMLNRDLGRFVQSVAGIATLLAKFWDEVPPRGEDGDYALRTVVIQGLDDNPSVVLPLQHAPILLTRRNGPLTYRTIVVAAEEAPARDGEAVLDRGTLDRAMADVELEEIAAARARIRTLGDALDAIQAITLEKAGYEGAANLEKLPPVVARIAAFLDAILIERDPDATAPPAVDEEPDDEKPGTAAAGGPPAAKTASPAALIPDAAAAVAALTAVLTYLRRLEPSNPACHLVAQALALQGRSFRDVVAMLLPDDASSAKILLGPDRLFGLSFEQLAESEASLENPSTEDAIEPEAEDEAEANSDEETDAEADGEVAPEPAAARPARPGPAIENRAAVSSLLDQIGAFYRRAEPSSPVPLFTDRARALMDRDFMTILKDVLPSIVPSE